VAAYQLNRLLRRFGGADAPKTFQANPETDFVARQIVRPLGFRPVKGGGGAAGGYGGYTGGHAAISIVDNVVDQVWFVQPVRVEIPEAGVRVGTVANHPSAAAVFLNRDGTYDARDAAGAVVSPPAALADLLLAVAGAAGASMKAEVKARVAPTFDLPGRDGSVTLLASSVGAEVVIPDPATPVDYVGVGPGPDGAQLLNVRVPDLAALAAGFAARGVALQQFDRPLFRIPPGGVEVARVFDDLGLRRVRLLADHTFVMTDESGATVAAGPNLPDVLLHGGPWLGGRGRNPA
jgi:hypothetical protein